MTTAIEEPQRDRSALGESACEIAHLFPLPGSWSEAGFAVKVDGLMTAGQGAS